MYSIHFSPVGIGEIEFEFNVISFIMFENLLALEEFKKMSTVKFPFLKYIARRLLTIYMMLNIKTHVLQAFHYYSILTFKINHSYSEKYSTMYIPAKILNQCNTGFQSLGSHLIVVTTYYIQ